MDIKELITFLQGLGTDMLQQANVHQLVAIQFGAQGFSKLERKYQEHASEERDFAEKFLSRVLDLGGDLVLLETKEQVIAKKPIEWLKEDLETSRKGLELLKGYLTKLAVDVTTYDLFKDYYKDEEDLYWTENQLELIEAIGYQNWLTQQL